MFTVYKAYDSYIVYSYFTEILASRAFLLSARKMFQTKKKNEFEDLTIVFPRRTAPNPAQLSSIAHVGTLTFLTPLL